MQLYLMHYRSIGGTRVPMTHEGPLPSWEGSLTPIVSARRVTEQNRGGLLTALRERQKRTKRNETGLLFSLTDCIATIEKF